MESANDSQENNAVQDRKLMWKLLKQQKKEAKRIKKEEEFLANLRKPKDTKVVLADKSFVEKLRNQNVPARAKRAPDFLAQDFPALSAKFPFPKPPPKLKEPTANSKLVENSVADRGCTTVPETTKRVEQANNCGDPSSTVTDNISSEPDGDPEQVNPISIAPVTTKKITKRKDPLVLYSNDLISKSTKKGRKSPVHEIKHRRKRRPEVVLCGNMLDSSHPVRKRGKHREIKKLKLSKLKLAIITDRILKQKGKSNSTGAELVDRKQLKIDIDEYLSNLTKSKLELAEKHRKGSEENKTEQTTPGEIIHTESEENKTEQTTPGEIIPAISEEKNVKKKATKYRKYVIAPVLNIRYCDNGYSEGLDKSVKNLITGIVYLQDRAFDKDAIKAHAKQKHVVGFREVKKYLTLKKIKMIVVAPDLEAKDAVFSVVEDLKKTASLQNVPCVFALSRRLLGFVAKKAVPVSAFGIMNYDGVEDRFAAVKEELKEAQDKCKLNDREIGNTNGKALEVTAVDKNSEEAPSKTGQAVIEIGENRPAPHKNKKKTKHVRTKIIVNKRLIDAQQ